MNNIITGYIVTIIIIETTPLQDYLKIIRTPESHAMIFGNTLVKIGF